MAERHEIIEHLVNRRWELALDPDNDGDNDTPGSGGDTDNDTPQPTGVAGLIFGHIARAEHHVGQMKKAHEGKSPAKADAHHKAAKHHMAEAKNAAKQMGSY